MALVSILDRLAPKGSLMSPRRRRGHSRVRHSQKTADSWLWRRVRRLRWSAPLGDWRVLDIDAPLQNLTAVCDERGSGRASGSECYARFDRVDWKRFAAGSRCIHRFGMDGLSISLAPCAAASSYRSDIFQQGLWRSQPAAAGLDYNQHRLGFWLQCLSEHVLRW